MSQQHKIDHALMMQESSEWQYALHHSGHCIKIICALEFHGTWGQRNKHKLKNPINGIKDVAEVITAYSGDIDGGHKLYTAIVKLNDGRYLYFRTTTNKKQRENVAAIAFTLRELIKPATMDFENLKLAQLMMDS